MSEIKRYVGGRMPVLGTPLAVVGTINDEKKMILSYEVHIFFDGMTKSYSSFELESNYEDVDKEQLPDYIKVTEQIVEDEIEKIIIDLMAEKNIPCHLYNKLVFTEDKNFTVLLYSLWSRGYDTEIDNIARTSKVEKLGSEFSKITLLRKVIMTPRAPQQPPL